VVCGKVEEGSSSVAVSRMGPATGNSRKGVRARPGVGGPFQGLMEGVG
jgi:hypothetical protein